MKSQLEFCSIRVESKMPGGASTSFVRGCVATGLEN